MHTAAFSLAALPPPTVILGLLMRPYSLGHELYLIREGNSFATNSPSFVDLPAAALICCQSWEENHRMPGDLLIGMKLALWKWRIRKMNLAQQALMFRQYQEAGSYEFPVSTIPKPDNKERKTRLVGSPFILRLHQWLMLTFRMSEAEAWNYPYGLAKCRWACFWESEGGLDIYNAHDQAHDEFVARMEAQEGQVTCQA